MLNECLVEYINVSGAITWGLCEVNLLNCKRYATEINTLIVQCTSLLFITILTQIRIGEKLVEKTTGPLWSN